MVNRAGQHPAAADHTSALTTVWVEADDDLPPETRLLFLRHGQRHQFAGKAAGADGDHDELAVVDHVGHRHAGGVGG